MMRTALSFVLLCVFTLTAQAAEYWVAEGDEVFGEVKVIKARHEDTFVSLARTHNVGYESLRKANPGIDAWLPGEGTEIVIPTRFVLPRAPQRGIVVNVAELRLYYFPPSSGGEPGMRKIVTYPISIGRMDWATPLGTTTITAKTANPSWYPPQSIRDEHAARNDILPRVVPPGPDNPLGKHALRLGLPGYLIHGTNRPSGVGMRVTHGCIRMFPEDIEELFNTVATGTTVRLVNQPFKLGWTTDGGLYLEAHPPLVESNVDGEVVNPTASLEDETLAYQESALTGLMREYIAATNERPADLHWETAERVVELGRGIPEFVSAPVTTAAVAKSVTADSELTADHGH